MPTCRSGAARPVQVLEALYVYARDYCHDQTQDYNGNAEVNVSHMPLVSILDVERSVELGIPTGLLLIMLAVNLLPSFHLCEPFVQVALEFVFVFHNLYLIHSRFHANLQAGRSGPAATTFRGGWLCSNRMSQTPTQQRLQLISIP